MRVTGWNTIRVIAIAPDLRRGLCGQRQIRLVTVLPLIVINLRASPVTRIEVMDVKFVSVTAGVMALHACKTCHSGMGR